MRRAGLSDAAQRRVAATRWRVRHSLSGIVTALRSIVSARRASPSLSRVVVRRRDAMRDFRATLVASSRASREIFARIRTEFVDTTQVRADSVIRARIVPRDSSQRVGRHRVSSRMTDTTGIDGATRRGREGRSMDRRLMGHEAQSANCPAPPEEAQSALRIGGREAGNGTTRQCSAWSAIRSGACGSKTASNMVTRATGSASARQRTSPPAVTRMRITAAPRAR